MKKDIIKEISLTAENVRDRIYVVRGKKVMLDRDLAMLYGVQTMRLNEAVRRNLKRFPSDFMFELTKDEMKNWISQIAISNGKHPIGTSNPKLKKSLRKPPLAFTEQGIAMLSSVLNSDRAILVNIQIIRIFTKMRELIDNYKELREKIEIMEEVQKANKATFREIFRVLRLLIREESKPKNKLGFTTE